MNKEKKAAARIARASIKLIKEMDWAVALGVPSEAMFRETVTGLWKVWNRNRRADERMSDFLTALMSDELTRTSCDQSSAPSRTSDR